MLREKEIFFFLLLAVVLLFSGCGRQEETQIKGELVMTGSFFIFYIL